MDGIKRVDRWEWAGQLYSTWVEAQDAKRSSDLTRLFARLEFPLTVKDVSDMRQFLLSFGLDLPNALLALHAGPAKDEPPPLPGTALRAGVYVTLRNGYMPASKIPGRIVSQIKDTRNGAGDFLIEWRDGSASRHSIFDLVAA